MKRLFSLVILWFVLLTGCSGSSPSDALKSFYKDVEQGKVNDAYALLSKDAQNLLSQLGSGPGMLMDQVNAIKKMGGIKEFKILKEEINGDTASVSMKLIFGNGRFEDTSDNLIKEDGKWKVVVKK